MSDGTWIVEARELLGDETLIGSEGGLSKIRGVENGKIMLHGLPTVTIDSEHGMIVALPSELFKIVDPTLDVAGKKE